jgi:hypothetical protein
MSQIKDRSNNIVAFQGSKIRAITTSEMSNGTALGESGYLYVSVNGGGNIQVKLTGDSSFTELYVPAGANPLVVTAVKTATSGTVLTYDQVFLLY